MKSPIKLALSILLGSSILTLVACDNQNPQNTEKTTALADSSNKESTQSDHVKTEAAPSETTEAKNEAENIQEIATPEKDGVPLVVLDEPKKVSKRSTRTHHESAYLREQKALLKTLQSQYQQVRCTPEAEKLGDNSFCRQEERRLFLEIERVKDEIRANK